MKIKFPFAFQPVEPEILAKWKGPLILSLPGDRKSTGGGEQRARRGILMGGNWEKQKYFVPLHDLKGALSRLL